MTEPEWRLDMAQSSDSSTGRVWQEWNALDDAEPAPVKTIALKLGMSTYEVARIVYPPATFDEWHDSQEPAVAGYDA